jgi:hypothetical protein
MHVNHKCVALTEACANPFPPFAPGLIVRAAVECAASDRRERRGLFAEHERGASGGD